MPDNTQKPNPDDFNPAKNAGQNDFDKIIDKNFSPGDEKMMEHRAQQGAERDLASQENDAANSVNDKDTDLEDKESRGSQWQDNTTEEDPIDGKSRISSFFRGKKNKLVIGFIVACVTIMGIMFSVLSGALGLVNIKESIISKLSQRADNVMTVRSNRVLVKKMSQDFTTGCTVKVKCRYKGMSTLEVRKFNKRNIGNGVRVVTEPSIIPGRQKVIAIETYQPAGEVVVGKDGTVNGKTIKSYKAREIRTAMRDVPQVGKAMITFYKPYVQYHSGKVARGMIKRIGVNLGKKKVDEGKGDNAREKLNSQQSGLLDKVQGVDTQTLERSADLPDSVDESIEERSDTLGEQAGDPAKVPYTPSPDDPSFDTAFGNAAKAVEEQGGGFSVAAAVHPLHFMMNYCTLRTLVKSANQVRKVGQTLQLIRYSTLFFTLADQIKAGDADGDTAETINVAMSMLTTTDADGLSAFDSAGYNWIQTGTVSTGYGEDVSRFQNGGQAAGLLGSAVTATTSGLGPMCKIANSDAATIGFLLLNVGGIAASVATGGAAAPLYAAARTGSATAVKTVAKEMVDRVVVKGITNTVSKKIKQKIAGQSKSKLAWKAVNNKLTRFGAVSAFFLYGTAPLIETLARTGSKTVTKGLVGPPSGNALVSGSGGLISKTSQAQGLEPITAEEAVEQDEVATKSTLTTAKLEGINHFDVSNQYSFSNKLALALTPAMSKFSNVGTVGSGFVGIYSTAFGGFSQKAYADSDAIKQYQFCKDEDYQSAGLDIATDPFCNPQYGFDMDIVRGSAYEPEKVVDYVYDNGFVDEEGEPVGEFADFVSKCLEGNTSIGQNDEGEVLEECVSREDKYRMMRMYCTDSSIDSDMKNETVGNCATKDADESSSATEEETAPTGSGGWSVEAGKDKNISSDLKNFMDEVAKHTSYEPIITTTTGGTHAAGSDHYSGNAGDFGSVANKFGTNNAQPGVSVPRGDELAAAALIAAGVAPDQARSKAKKGLSPGTDDVTATINGRQLRVQVIWKSTGHFDHVHIGIKRK